MFLYVSTDNMLGHMGLAITVFLWARPQPESKVGGGLGYYWLATVAWYCWLSSLPEAVDGLHGKPQSGLLDGQHWRTGYYTQQ